MLFELADTIVQNSNTPSDLKALSKAVFGESEFIGKSPVDTGRDWINPSMIYMIDKKLEGLNI